MLARDNTEMLLAVEYECSLEIAKRIGIDTGSRCIFIYARNEQTKANATLNEVWKLYSVQEQARKGK